MEYFIDANIFLRVAAKESQKSFVECYRLLETVRLNKIKAVTSSVVLAEIVWTLRSYYKFPKEKINQIMKAILNLRGLKIVDNYDSYWATTKFEKTNAKYIDCLIASIEKNRHKKWTIVSYDEDFDKLEVLRKEPKQILVELG